LQNSTTIAPEQKVEPTIDEASENSD